MKFFFPDSQDLVDPSFDFEKETRSDLIPLLCSTVNNWNRSRLNLSARFSKCRQRFPRRKSAAARLTNSRGNISP